MAPLSFLTFEYCCLKISKDIRAYRQRAIISAGCSHSGDQLVGEIVKKEAANVVVLNNDAKLATEKEGTWQEWEPKDGPAPKGNEALFLAN